MSSVLVARVGLVLSRGLDLLLLRCQGVAFGLDIDGILYRVDGGDCRSRFGSKDDVYVLNLSRGRHFWEGLADIRR